eukprot:scaffold14533_cov51-Phaeocystis_antarctica.AAC.2
MRGAAAPRRSCPPGETQHVAHSPHALPPHQAHDRALRRRPRAHLYGALPCGRGLRGGRPAQWPVLGLVQARLATEVVGVILEIDR